MLRSGVVCWENRIRYRRLTLALNSLFVCCIVTTFGGLHVKHPVQRLLSAPVRHYLTITVNLYYSSTLSPYRAVNTLGLGYTNQSVNVV